MNMRSTIEIRSWRESGTLTGIEKTEIPLQYLRQLRKAEGRLRSMNTAQAGHLVENLG